jgi:hypothetical protein
VGSDNSTVCSPGIISPDAKTLTFSGTPCITGGGTGLYVMRVTVCSPTSSPAVLAEPEIVNVSLTMKGHSAILR